MRLSGPRFLKSCLKGQLLKRYTGKIKNLHLVLLFGVLTQQKGEKNIFQMDKTTDPNANFKTKTDSIFNKSLHLPNSGLWLQHLN